MWNLIEKLYLRKKGNLAYYDQQLQVYNRNWFEDHRTMLTELECDVIMVDMNNFKTINDTYGHAKGDEVLLVMTNIAKAVYHKHNDFIIRLGGDEFLICSPNSEESKFVKFLPAYHFSYGIVHKSAGSDISDAIKKADQKMYKMKQEFHRLNK